MNALELNFWFKRHWKLVLLILIAVILLGETIFQIVYPSSHLIPGTKVDGYSVGGLRKTVAATELDAAYGKLKLDIYFGKNQAAFQSPMMSDVGIGVDMSARVAALDYPFYLRIIPGSIFWASALEKPGDIAYTYDKDKIASYTISKVGTNCSINPQNASLKLIDSQLQLVPSSTGGTCDITQFQQNLAEVQPDSSKANSVHIDINETPAPVTDDMARDLASKLNHRMATSMPITVDSNTDTVPGRIVLSWLDFTADVPQQSIDNSANQQASLDFSVNTDRMQQYLDQGIASKLIVKPGVSRVSTNDFTETSRVNGANGRDVNLPVIASSVIDYLNSKVNTAVGATVVVGPSTVYTRSYTPDNTGFSALLAQYAQDNPGTWGIAFSEISGLTHPRSASFNADARIKAGGIHSLYLGYTLLNQEAANVARPVDIISGTTNASDCFTAMYVESDADCITGFYDYFGYQTLVANAQQIGLTNTVFAGDDTVTSANDVQNTLVGLYKSTIAHTIGGDRILNALRTTRAHDGIPAGAASGDEISHVIGETDTVHNDSAIIYTGNHGTYALTVMSDGSSWDKVAGLEAKITALKAVKIPTTTK